MKRMRWIIAMMLALVVVACDDDPEFIFKGQTFSYQLNGDRTLTVTFDGVKVTDKDSGAVIEYESETLATLTLTQLIDGHDVVVANVVVTKSDDGAIIFEGKAAVSATEVYLIRGEIRNGVMTLEITPVQA